jgi:hypothetical protein
MTSPAPQPAPLRPGQRAALALLAKPGAYATWSFLGAFVRRGKRPPVKLNGRTFWSLAYRRLTVGKLLKRAVMGFRITPAGRAALRAGSREGGRGRRR